MTLLEAIKERHSVRKYTDEPIPGESLAILDNTAREINEKTGLHIQLVTDEPKAFSGLVCYGSFAGVKNYFVMAGKKDDLDEKIGYWGEQLVLLAQTVGLNTCWVGMSYSKIPGTYELKEGEKIACYIALGIGRNPGSGHKVKLAKDVSNVGDDSPTWFKKGIEAALLAPTAVNQQKFFIEYLGQRDSDKLPLVSAKPTFSLIGYTKMDLGIVKYHFELGAGEENFEWA